jgi:hypothetical protein
MDAPTPHRALSIRTLRPLRTLAALALCFLLPNLAQAQAQWRPQTAGSAKSAPPSHLASVGDLPAGSVQRMRRGPAAKSGHWSIQLPNGSEQHVEFSVRVAHANGDVSYSGSLVGVDGRFGVIYTEGREGSFASIDAPTGRYRLESFGERAWLVALDHPQLREGESGAPRSLPGFKPPVHAAAVPKNFDTVIDLLALYSEGFAARYPGSIAQTRINHLITVSNQVLANSGVSMAVRLVGADLSTYPDSIGPNSDLLNSMRLAASGQVTHPSLLGLRARRAELGADLVSFLRPHDIETRGNCGIAYLFGGGSNNGVNVVSDGFSSWSLCADEVLIHEIGHNLGAEHQNGANSPNAGFGTAHVLPGRFNTVMGSVGSGNPDRYRRLLRFSNPQQRCGGAPCGVSNVSDNARRLRQNMAAVAAYQPMRSSLPMPALLPPQDPDSDGDGVPDSEDAFPFDPAFSRDRDGDGVADPIDAFPDDPAEWADTDGDGIPDNVDPDRDNDGFANAVDAFPLDRLEWSDRDGDGVGDNGDAFPDDPRESRDTDGDGIGDHADPDVDGDGRPDLRRSASMTDHDLLVVSNGTDRLLRLRGDSGRYAGVELAPRLPPQAFGFQSALAWNPAQKQVMALINTQLRQFAPADGKLQSVAVGFSGGPRPTLPSSFPAGLAVAEDGTAFIADESSRGVYRRQAITARDLPGGSFGQANLLTGAPRGLALAPGNRLWLLQRDGVLREFDTVSGLQLRELAAPLVGGEFVSEATAVAFDAARARLLIADAPNHRVLSVEPSSAVASLLVPPGAGGLSAPSGLALGPDGLLYVSSAGNHQVLRFDAVSGAPLLFVPRVDDRFPSDRERQLRPAAGAWYDPERPGHGFDIQNSDGVVSVVWYTYTDSGTPTWYLAVAPLRGSRLQAELLRYRWQNGIATSNVVGSIDLQFEREDRARFNWVLGMRSGSEPIQPLWLGETEESAFPTAAWYPPSQSGWGLSIARGGDIYTAIAFLYDIAGEPSWAAGPIRSSGSNLLFDLFRYRGTNLCPGCSGPSVADASLAGPLSLRITGEDAAQVEIDLQSTGLNWQRSELGFRRLTGTPTQINGDPRP